MKKMMLHVVSMMLVLSLLPHTSVMAQDELSFPDVPETHWAYEDVMSGVKKGYINGLPDGTFAPERSVSRSEFIKMVVAALNLPIDEQNPDELWYTPYTSAAVSGGLIDQDEYPDNNFAKEMTRMEMVRVVVKAIDEASRDENKLDEERMLYAVENGIIRGIDGKTVPEGLSSRSQAVTVIERMLTLLDGGELPTDENALETATIEYRIAIGDIWEVTNGYRRIYNDIGRYFELKVLESIYIEDGHLKGYLPPIPEGTMYHLGFMAQYDPKDKIVANLQGIEFLIGRHEMIPGEHFSLPIKAVDKAQEIILRVTLENAEMPSNRRATTMYYLDNKRIVENVRY